MRRIVVVGGGASGMAAAIAAAADGAQVVILEQNDRVGKKLLATGNGRCNFTNRVQTADCYRSENAGFPWSAVERFDEKKTEGWFQGLGICARERGGGLYPFSEQGSAVLDALRWELERRGVQVSLRTRAERIEKRNGAFLLHTVIEETKEIDSQAEQRKGSAKRGEASRVSEKKGSAGQGKNAVTRRPLCFHADAVILACGSKASSIAGSDGSGYRLARELGHRIVPVLPALVQLRCKEPFYRALAGVRAQGSVSLYVDGRLAAMDTGEIQFTDYGISGIPVFQVSRWASQALAAGQEVKAALDFLPGLKEAEARRMLEERKAVLQDRELERFFTGLFHKKLSQVLLKRAALEPQRTAGSLTEEECGRLFHVCRYFETRVTAANGFAQAQVCAGGVDTREVYPETMESRLVPGLYFAGELLDVDGMCGGYNLQWAWSSGNLAGKGAARDQDQSIKNKDRT